MSAFVTGVFFSPFLRALINRESDDVVPAPPKNFKHAQKNALSVPSSTATRCLWGFSPSSLKLAPPASSDVQQPRMAADGKGNHKIGSRACLRAAFAEIP